MLIISDILFIAIDNVYKHSGKKKCYIEIITNKMSSLVLRIKISNDISTSLLIDRTNIILNEIKNNISSGEYLSKVNTEGGSGLIKVASMCQKIEFGFLCREKFFLEVDILLTNFSVCNDE